MLFSVGPQMREHVGGRGKKNRKINEGMWSTNEKIRNSDYEIGRII